MIPVARSSFWSLLAASYKKKANFSNSFCRSAPRISRRPAARAAAWRISCQAGAKGFGRLANPREQWAADSVSNYD